MQVSLLEESIKPRTNLPPLLLHLRERRPEKLHYLGVSFGLTLDLFRFWRKHKFVPFYIGQIPVSVSSLYFHLSGFLTFIFKHVFSYKKSVQLLLVLVGFHWHISSVNEVRIFFCYLVLTVQNVVLIVIIINSISK